MPSSADKIPNLYHFIWIGDSKPYFLILAIQSVLVRCKDAEVTLWVEGSSQDSIPEDLTNRSDFTVRKIDFEQLLQALDSGHASFIKSIFQQAGTKSNLENTMPLERTRSNLLRYLILYNYGGVYLDADTLVLKDMYPLIRDNHAFIGKENSIWPIVKRRNPVHRFIWAPFLEVFRWLAIQLPFGYYLNSPYRLLCGSSENNAVIGCTPKHPFINACFDFMTKMTLDEIRRPLRLGPFLFQRVRKTYPQTGVKVYPEVSFYPYGPLMSQHYFRKRRDASSTVSAMVDEATFLVHWGASTKFLKSYTKEEVLRKRHQSVFARLASETIEAFDG